MFLSRTNDDDGGTRRCPPASPLRQSGGQLGGGLLQQRNEGSKRLQAEPEDRNGCGEGREGVALRVEDGNGHSAHAQFVLLVHHGVAAAPHEVVGDLEQDLLPSEQEEAATQPPPGAVGAGAAGSETVVVEPQPNPWGTATDTANVVGAGEVVPPTNTVTWSTVALGPIVKFDQKKRYSLGLVPSTEKTTTCSCSAGTS